jgi:tetraacyldisaccharide 4'-kinase
MPQHPPKFWAKPVPPLWAMLLLSPIAKIYQILVQWRLKQRPAYHAPIPVICVGNISLGGAGKTPVVQAMVTTLIEMGFEPAILLRGYGGYQKEPCQVDVSKHTANQVGDEALLHATKAPTWVSVNRAHGAKAIVESGLANIIVLDDGLQNHALYYDLRLMVVDTSQNLGNGCLFPLGPLRETLAHALKRVNAVVQVGAGERGFLLPHGFTVLRGAVNALAEPSASQYLAFAGIGYPQKFYATLAQHGFNVVATKNFADHYVYNDATLQALQQQAKILQAQLITTQKDWVRLPKVWQNIISYLPVSLSWQKPEAIKQFLQQHLPQ